MAARRREFALLLLLQLAASFVQQQQRSAPRRPAARLENSKRTLHELSPVQSEGDLDVGGGHTVHYRVYGKSKTAPVALFLHGGPGAGCFANHARFFDPGHWRVCLVDQRGCGKSKPLGELAGNTTPDLVEDLEKLRTEVGVAKWACVLGGSWGSTLALAYATAHRQRVGSLILRGVCTMRPREIDWLFSPDGGAATLAPRAWKNFAAHVDCDKTSKRGVLEAYHALLTGDDPTRRSLAARHWMQWESAVSSVSSRRGVAKFVNGRTWRFDDGDDDQPSSSATLYKAPAVVVNPQNNNSTAIMKGWVPAQAMLTCHYSVKNAFFYGTLLDNLDAIRDLPAIAVQGGADTICPPTTAFELHERWPELELRLVTGAGHSQYDPDIAHELLGATDDIYDRLYGPTSSAKR